MPIRFYRRQESNTLGDAILAGMQGWTQGVELRRKSEKDAIANAYMLAKIRELQRNADFEVPLDEATGQPLYHRVGGRWKANPVLSRRNDPKIAAEIESGVSGSGLPLNPNYRQALANQYGYSSLKVGDAEPVYRRPGVGLRGIERAQGFQTNFLDPLELEAQAAIRAGKDPGLVKQRLLELRGQRG